jgi:hypothetical protein
LLALPKKAIFTTDDTDKERPYWGGRYERKTVGFDQRYQCESLVSTFFRQSPDSLLGLATQPRFATSILSTMERGVATITCAEDWEKAVQHLWGVSLSDFAIFRTAERRQRPAAQLEKFRRGRGAEIAAYLSGPVLVEEPAAA